MTSQERRAAQSLKRGKYLYYLSSHLLSCVASVRLRTRRLLSFHLVSDSVVSALLSSYNLLLFQLSTKKYTLLSVVYCSQKDSIARLNSQHHGTTNSPSQIKEGDVVIIYVAIGLQDLNIYQKLRERVSVRVGETQRVCLRHTERQNNRQQLKDAQCEKIIIESEIETIQVIEIDRYR